MELFAERGRRGPTLKAVAERAGVSPGLVQHHYKTKQGLLAGVQSWVAEQLADIGGELSSGEANLGVDSARYDAFLAANPVVAAYLRRVLLESTAIGNTEWFTDAVALRRERLGGDEPERSEVTAAMVVLVDLAPVLLGPLLEHALNCDSAELAARWRRVETTLLGLPSGQAG
ncbi:TetR/AcrR family transcriptional regulator [Mycobacterium hubeiense]|uniref:TetR/AcrR family transcriptional regulator n=1 Tax=Mycobacterium hubeiense TaxID=1867256 RepID=UPI001E3732DA|nr:TetR/AcrR family transcriptional regulator [Mycobacterium sp. QGD 101]